MGKLSGGALAWLLASSARPALGYVAEAASEPDAKGFTAAVMLTIMQNNPKIFKPEDIAQQEKVVEIAQQDALLKEALLKEGKDKAEAGKEKEGEKKGGEPKKAGKLEGFRDAPASQAPRPSLEAIPPAPTIGFNDLLASGLKGVKRADRAVPRADNGKKIADAPAAETPAPGTVAGGPAAAQSPEARVAEAIRQVARRMSSDPRLWPIIEEFFRDVDRVQRNGGMSGEYPRGFFQWHHQQLAGNPPGADLPPVVVGDPPSPGVLGVWDGRQVTVTTLALQQSFPAQVVTLRHELTHFWDNYFDQVVQSDYQGVGRNPFGVDPERIVPQAEGLAYTQMLCFDGNRC